MENSVSTINRTLGDAMQPLFSGTPIHTTALFDGRVPFPTVAQAVTATLFSYVLWRLIRPYFVKSPLAHIAGPKSTSWWAGNFNELFSRFAWNYHLDLGKKYGSLIKVHGLFGVDTLYLSDPLAMHHIVIKDVDIYEETDATVENINMTFGTCLLSSFGDAHRKQRKMLNPVFSLKHMRNLAPVFYPIAHELRRVIMQQVHVLGGGEAKDEQFVEFNVMKYLSRAALEYIGQGGLGYSFGSVDGKRSSDYLDATRALGPVSSKLAKILLFLPYVTKLGPGWLRRKIVDLMPFDVVHAMKNGIDALDAKAREVYTVKKAALLEGDEAVVTQVGRGKDILSVLMKANMSADENDRLPEEEFVSQMNLLIFAGHDTTTSALSLALEHLSKRQDVQSRLRQEIREARNAWKEKQLQESGGQDDEDESLGDLGYDTLMALPLLDAVCRETLRVEPPVPALTRIARKDATLPLAFPVKSADGLTEVREVAVPAGTNIILSILNSNQSKEVWGSDAGEWVPDRWLRPLPDNVGKVYTPGVYSNIMTFLGGGRACLGFKFAELEMKLVLSILLDKFVFKPSDKEILWDFNGVRKPVVKGDEMSPRLPIRVAIAEV